MSHSSAGEQPASRRALGGGIATALLLAAGILTVAVLPAEYGIDPTGAGKALGLTAMKPVNAATATATAAASAAASGQPGSSAVSARQDPPYRTDQREVQLPPGGGLEVKTRLQQGAALLYSWKTKNGERIHHEFHGEKPNAKEDEFESFIKDDAVDASRGSLIAPFSGTHGWYWRNDTAAPVTVLLQASGFYTDIFNP